MNVGKYKTLIFDYNRLNPLLAVYIAGIGNEMCAWTAKLATVLSQCKHI